MKTSSNSGILKTIFHNGGYLLLFGKRKLQSFKRNFIRIIPLTLK